jgi:NADH-quinone oxidoreductase subunit J
MALYRSRGSGVGNMTAVFGLLAGAIVFSGFRVVTSRNVMHSALYLVGALGGTAALFVMLSAEFVAWVLVLVYIGAVIVLFLFGVMITRAPMGREASLDNEKRGFAAATAGLLFLMLSGSSLYAFKDVELQGLGETVSTADLGISLLGRFVLPFEIVSFLLLAALIGGIVLARKDLTPAQEEEGGAV